MAVIVAERPGRAAFFLFKEPVEIGDIIEATIIRNFCDGLVGIDEQA